MRNFVKLTETLDIDTIEDNLDVLFMPILFLGLALLLHVLTSFCVWRL